MNYIKNEIGMGKYIDRKISENELWDILVEAIHSLTMYPYHKAYLIEKILPENPLITPKELANLLSIPLGEAIVLLYELRINAKELEEEIKKPLPKNKKYSKVALGGTFDEIHYGHLSLLWTAFKNGEKVLIGLTSDEFAKNFKKHSIKQYSERLKDLKEVLKKYNWLEAAEIVTINDAYGIATIDPTLDAIIVSPFTAGIANEINRLRIEKLLKPLEIEICPLVLAEDGKPISSTRIISGEITIDGKIIKKNV